MPIDINLLRPDRGKSRLQKELTREFLIGGDPEKVKASQRARFADEAIVDQIMELDAQQRTGKCARLNLECQKLRTRLTLILAPCFSQVQLGPIAC